MKNLNLERATVQSELIGNVYRIGGKAYVLSADELIYDAETQDLVLESHIYNQVLERHEEDKQVVSEIRKKAKELSKGNPAIEEAYLIHFAFTGLPQKPERTESIAA